VGKFTLAMTGCTDLRQVDASILRSRPDTVAVRSWTPRPTLCDWLRTLADSVGFHYRWDAEAQQFEHPAVSMVLGPDGKITRYLYGVEFNPRDLKLAVLEAAQGRVGTTLDRVILKCFKYDPASRKYHFYVMGALRAGSGLFAAALAALLGVLWWREARKGKEA